MNLRDDTTEPTVAGIAALTARLRDLSGRGAGAGDAERAAFLADKDALLARIAQYHRTLDDHGSAVPHEHNVLVNRLTPLRGTPGASPFDRGSPPLSAEDAAQDLAADDIPLDQARAMVRDYQDEVSQRIGCSVHRWGLDAPDLTDLRETNGVAEPTRRGHADGEAEHREQLARWHADDPTSATADEYVPDGGHGGGTAS